MKIKIIKKQESRESTQDTRPKLVLDVTAIRNQWMRELRESKEIQRLENEKIFSANQTLFNII